MEKRESARDEILKYITEVVGVDDAGVALVTDYHSPKSYPIEHLMPSARTMIVVVFKELSGCLSPSATMAMNSRLDMAAFGRTAIYQIGRFLERNYGAKVVSVPYSTPMEIHSDRPAVADFSQRHAAVAAGLGTFGRNNLVLHPRFGPRMGIATILTDLDLAPTPKLTEDVCIHCDICVANCPGKALEDEGVTQVPRCAVVSQPYGRHREIAFWKKVVDASPEEQKEMFGTEEFARIKQAGSLGMQYCCFNCIASCPVGK